MKFYLRVWLIIVCWGTTLVQADPGHTSLSLDYDSGFVENDPVLSFAAQYQQKLDPLYGIQCVQGISKNFYTDATQTEWVLGDTMLALLLYPMSLVPPVTWTVRLGMTLPLSQASRRNQVYSRPELASTASYALSTATKISATGFLRMPWSAYQTTAGTDGVGGDPLPRYAYGAAFTLLQEAFWQSQLFLRASYYETKYYKSTEEGASTLPLLGLPEQGYSLTLRMEWPLTEQLALTGGISQGSVLEQAGLSDYKIFDEEASTWSLGIGYSF